MEKINKDAVRYYFEKSTIDNNYTKIPNELWGLDIKPMYKIILAYMMSNSDDFYITNYRICNVCSCNRKTVIAAFKFFTDNKIITIKNNQISFNRDGFIGIGSSTYSTIGSPTHTDIGSPTYTIGSPTHTLEVHQPSNNTNNKNNEQKEVNREEENKTVNSTQSIESVNSNKSIVGEKTYEEKFEYIKKEFGFTFLPNDLPNLENMFNILFIDFLNSSRLETSNIPNDKKDLNNFTIRLKGYYNSNKAVYN